MSCKKGKMVCDEIRSLHHSVYRSIENSPGKQKLKSLSGTNACIIGYITKHSDSDVFQKDIEKDFGITRSTASKIINLMEEKGLIRREKVDYDARLKKIVLTEETESVSHSIYKDVQNIEKIMLTGFSADEKNQMLDFIERMKNNLKSYSEEQRRND